MTDKELKALIEGRHPEYAENLPHWDFLEATYEGGREWFAGNIFRYVKEGDLEYAERLERAYRFNHTKQVVDQINKYLFKMPIARKVEDAPDFVKAYWKRATRSGLDIETFSKRISTATSQFGRVYIVVDSSVGQGEVATKADEKKLGAQVYTYIVRPQDMLDISYDDMGQMNWCLVREFGRDDEDPFASSRNCLERFRLWTREGWLLFQTEVKNGKKRYVLVDTGEHGLGVVPVVQADHTFTEEQYEAAGLIDDVAYLDRAIANYLSNLDAIIQDQTFSQLAMPAQGVLPGESGYDKLLEMGTKRVFLFDGQAGEPKYLSPDPKQAQLILTAIIKIVAEIYHSSGLSGERTKDDNGGGIDNASGVAKSYDFERVNSLLTAKAAALELTEKNILRIVALYNGKTDYQPDELLQYPTEFDVRSVYDEFEIATQLSMVSAPDEVRQEQMLSLVKKLFPSASKALMASLESALKKWKPTEQALAAGGDQADLGKKAKAVKTQSTAKKLAS